MTDTANTIFGERPNFAGYEFLSALGSSTFAVRKMQLQSCKVRIILEIHRKSIIRVSTVEMWYNKRFVLFQPFLK